MTMEKRTCIFLSAFASLLSIAAICFALLRCEPIKADWMAILVGILALLTASLIGWQIYRAIELDRIIRRFDSIVNDRTLAISHDINHVITAFGHRMSSRRPVVQPESQEKSIMYLMMALEEVLKIETPGTNIESIDNIMADFKEVVDMYKDEHPLNLSEEEKDRYLQILRKIEHEYAIVLTKYISHAQ